MDNVHRVEILNEALNIYFWLFACHTVIAYSLIILSILLICLPIIFSHLDSFLDTLENAYREHILETSPRAFAVIAVI